MRSLTLLLVLVPTLAAFAQDRYSTAGTPFGRQAVEAMPIDGVSRELSGRRNGGQRPNVRSVQYEDESLGRDSRFATGDPRGSSQTMPPRDNGGGWPTTDARANRNQPAYPNPANGNTQYDPSTGRPATSSRDSLSQSGTTRSIMPPTEDVRFRRDPNHDVMSERESQANRWAQSNSPDPSDLNPNTNPNAPPPNYDSRTNRDDPYGRSESELSESSESRRYPLTMLLLFASIGLNVYLFWISLDTYNRYQDLVNDMRGRRSKRDPIDGDLADRPAEAAY